MARKHHRNPPRNKKGQFMRRKHHRHNPVLAAAGAKGAIAGARALPAIGKSVTMGAKRIVVFGSQ